MISWITAPLSQHIIIIMHPNLHQVIYIPIFPKLGKKIHSLKTVNVKMLVQQLEFVISVFFSKMPQAREVKLQFAKYARFAPLHLKELAIYNVALYALKHTFKKCIQPVILEKGHWPLRIITCAILTGVTANRKKAQSSKLPYIKCIMQTKR